MRKTLLSLALLTSLGSAQADEDISTDRPDFTESPEVLAAGRVQIETSVAWAREKTGGLTLRTRSTPTLIRVGLGHELELRLETDGWIRATAAGVSESGRGDLSLGLKWQTADGDEAKGTPSVGWLFHVDTPSGSGAFKGRGLRPSVRVAAEWELHGGYSIGAMTGVFTERNDEDRRYHAALASVTLAIPINEKWHGFVELAAEQLASKANGGNVVSANTGLAWKLTPDLQLDTAIGRGVTRNAPDWTYTVGISARF